MLYTWKSDDHPEDIQFDAWKAMLTTTYDLSFEKPKASGFKAYHNAFPVNGLMLRRGQVDPFACERTSREIRQSSTPFYTVQGTAAGRQFVDYLGVNTELKPGEAYLWDSEHVGKVHVPEAMEIFSMVIPKSFLDSRLQHRTGLNILPGNSAISSLLFSTIATTISNANSFEKSQYQSVLDVILSLTTAAFTAPIDDQRVSYQAAKLERIKSYIQSRIEDPNLSPAQVASALGISLRGLHMAFSESSDTFGSHLQNARIKQAALDLRQNPNGFQSITEIAYKHGFNSSSQFSRVFKRHLQLTPREYKKIHS